MTTPPNPVSKPDKSAIVMECRSADVNGDTISDACAREIAAAWHGGPGTRAHAFAATGAILNPDAIADETGVPQRFRDAPGLLWWELFGHPATPGTDGGPLWATLDRGWVAAAVMFERSVFQRAARGPQPGWSALRPRYA